MEQSVFKVRLNSVVISGVIAHEDISPPSFTKTWLNSTPVLPGSVAVGATSTGLILCSFTLSIASATVTGSRPVATTACAKLATSLSARVSFISFVSIFIAAVYSSITPSICATSLPATCSNCANNLPYSICAFADNPSSLASLIKFGEVFARSKLSPVSIVAIAVLA